MDREVRAIGAGGEVSSRYAQKQSKLLREWIRTVVAYDGVLPCIIFLVPWVLPFVFPEAFRNRNGDGVAIASVLVPAIALVYRIYLADHQLRRLRGWWRGIPLVLALVVLAGGEGVCVLASLEEGKRDWSVVGIVAVCWMLYLFLMGLALFPCQVFTYAKLANTVLENQSQNNAGQIGIRDQY